MTRIKPKLAMNVVVSLPWDKRSPMMPEPTTIASSSAVPIASAARRRANVINSLKIS